MRFNRMISLCSMEKNAKHPDATITEQGQSYCLKKNLSPLKNLVSTDTLEAISNQILCKKKKNLRIPPHPTTKQRMLFLRRMGYPAQTMMKENAVALESLKGLVFGKVTMQKNPENKI